MEQGIGRFTLYLTQVQDLMEKAHNEKDPAMWLFANNARIPFFMLEALSRLYAGLHNKKRFDKMRNRFKFVEDGLGQIDYYNALLSAFEKNKKVPRTCISYFKKKTREAAASLNEQLKNEEWILTDHSRIRKIKSKLESAGWLKPEEEIKEISGFYKDEIKEINDFVLETKYLFDNIEEDVHELRRKLRWLSIYPQAMNGVFQFDASSPAPAFLEKYTTPEITGSPFNKLPAPGSNTSFIILNKYYFYALSWMIAKLGELKDEGLLATGLAEAIKHTTESSDEIAIRKAYAITGRKLKKLEAILDEAELLTKTFIKEKNLKKLVMRTETAKKKILKHTRPRKK